MGQGSSSKECPKCESVDCPAADCPTCPSPTDCAECPIKISNNMKVYDVIDPIMNHFAPEDLQIVKEILERNPEGKKIFQGSMRAFINTNLNKLEENQKRQQKRQQNKPLDAYNSCLAKSAGSNSENKGIGFAIGLGQDHQILLKQIEDEISEEAKNKALSDCIDLKPPVTAEGFRNTGSHNFKYCIAFLVLLFIYINR